jgi:hypothetical protein
MAFVAGCEWELAASRFQADMINRIFILWNYIISQGDQKGSVHLMVTIFKISPASLQIFIDTTLTRNSICYP